MPTRDRESGGVPPQAGSGCQPAASAAEEASSQSGIPNAGDRVRILRGDNGPGWLRVGAMATVAYALPDYGKIICKLDEPVAPHVNCCLYKTQEGEHWERVA